MRDLGKLMNDQGKIMIAALDHRGSIAKELPTEEEMEHWKRLMVNLYKNEVTGILIDPIYGERVRDDKARCSWMVSLEKTGYRGGQQARVTELMDDWGVKQAKEAGYSAVKLLLYYDPKNRELASKQKDLAMRVSRECEKENITYLLEPLTYRKSGDQEEQVLRMVAELREIPVDIWKFEYPGSLLSCREITTMVDKPWVLLSAGLSYLPYVQALTDAMRGGASGFAVGRAVWQEFSDYQGEEREKFLTGEALVRMQKLKEIVINV